MMSGYEKVGRGEIAGVHDDVWLDKIIVPSYDWVGGDTLDDQEVSLETIVDILEKSDGTCETDDDAGLLFRRFTLRAGTMMLVMGGNKALLYVHEKYPIGENFALSARSFFEVKRLRFRSNESHVYLLLKGGGVGLYLPVEKMF